MVRKNYDPLLVEKGEKIQVAFNKFVRETGFNLKKVCKKWGDPHNDFNNVRRWLPQDPAHGSKTTSQTVFNNFVLRLKKLLNAGEYELIDENENPCDLGSPDIAFFDEKNEKLRYRPMGAKRSQTIFELFDIEDDPSVQDYQLKFLMLYRKSNNKIAKHILYLNTVQNKAIISKGKGEQKIEGSVYLQGGATYVIHIEKDNPENTVKNYNPKFIYWQIIFPRSKSGKEFFWGSFSKVTSDNLATHGIVVLIAPELGKSINLHTVKSVADAFLNDSTRTLSFGKRSLNRLYEDLKEDDYEIKLFKALKPYIGTYEGYFTYPPRKRFENAQMTIYESGEVKIWVDANPNEPYNGIARKLSKDLLFIKYDYQPALLDYRAYIVLDTSGKSSSSVCDKNSNNPTLYGVLGGIDRDIAHPVITRVAVRKRDNRPLNLEESKIELKVIPLENEYAPTLFKELQELKLERFFLGLEKIEYSSLAFLQNLKKEAGL